MRLCQTEPMSDLKVPTYGRPGFAGRWLQPRQGPAPKRATTCACVKPCPCRTRRCRPTGAPVLQVGGFSPDRVLHQSVQRHAPVLKRAHVGPEGADLREPRFCRSVASAPTWSCAKACNDMHLRQNEPMSDLKVPTYGSPGFAGRWLQPRQGPAPKRATTCACVKPSPCRT